MSSIFGDGSGSDEPTIYDISQDQNLTTSINQINNIIAGSDVNLNPIIARLDSVELVNDNQTNSINSIEALNTIQTNQINNINNVEIPRINSDFGLVFDSLTTLQNYDIANTANLQNNYRSKIQNDVLYYPLIGNPSGFLTSANIGFDNYYTKSEIDTQASDYVRDIDLASYPTFSQTTGLINIAVAPKLDTTIFNTQITSINNSITSINTVNSTQDNAITSLDIRVDSLEIKPFQTATQTTITPINAVTATNTQQALENLKFQIDNIATSGTGFNSNITDFINGMNTNYLTNTLIYNVFNTPILRSKFWSDISSITQRLGSNNTVLFGGIFANLGNSTGNKTFRIRGNWFNENNDTDILRVDQSGDFVSQRRDGLSQPVYNIWEITNQGRTIKFNTNATIGVYNGIGQASSKSISDLILENQDSFIYLRDNIKNNPFITSLNQSVATTSNVQFNLIVSNRTDSNNIFIEGSEFDEIRFTYRTTQETRCDINDEGRFRLYGKNRANNTLPSYQVDTFGNVTSQGNINSNQISANTYIDGDTNFVRPHYFDFDRNLTHLIPQNALFGNLTTNILRNSILNDPANGNEFYGFSCVGTNNIYASLDQQFTQDATQGTHLYGNGNTITRMSLNSVLLGNKNQIRKNAFLPDNQGQVNPLLGSFLCLGNGNYINENAINERSDEIILGNSISHDRTNNPVVYSGPYKTISIGNNIVNNGSNIMIGNDLNVVTENTNGNGYVLAIGSTWGGGPSTNVQYRDLGNGTTNRTLLFGSGAINTGPNNINFGGEIPPIVSGGAIPVYISLSRGPIGSGFGQYSLVTPASSKRYKENIKTKTFNMDDFMKLRSVEYTPLNDNSINFGLIAEEVNEIIPEYVVKEQNNNEVVCKTVIYDRMVSMLIDIIQQQEIRIRNLENKI